MIKVIERDSNNKNAMIIAIIGGILLILSGLNGVTAMNDIKDFVKDEISDDDIIQYGFIILILIASLGGFAVIIGGLLIWKNKLGIGRFIIGVGAVAGLIGLLAHIYYGISEGTVILYTYHALGALGIILSMVARRIANPRAAT